MTGLKHKYAIIRRQDVDERCLPGAGAASRIDDHRAGAAEDRLQPLQALRRQLCELRTTMVDRGSIDGAQNAVRNIGWTRDLEEVATTSARVMFCHNRRPKKLAARRPTRASDSE